MYRVNIENSLLRIVAFGTLGANIGYMHLLCILFISVLSCLQPPSRSDFFIDTQDPSMPMLPDFSPQLTDSLSRGIIGSMMPSLSPPILLLLS